VPDADEAEKPLAPRDAALLEIELIQARDELAHVRLADALGRALASPECEEVENAGQRPTAPADIDADDLEVIPALLLDVVLAARLGIELLRELGVQLPEGPA
jgi:hypothetical protein